MNLRAYQKDTIEKVLQSVQDGHSKPLAVLATGLGKTVIFSYLIKEYLRLMPEKKVLVLAHRAELIWQAVEKLKAICNCRVGVEMGEHRTLNNGSDVDIIVSTIQTQIAGGSAGRMALFDAEEFGLVVVDEAHHACSPTYRKVINYYLEGGGFLFGVTATPDRGDKKSLGKVFDVVAQDYDVSDGIRDGWLTPIQQRMITITDLDFSHIRTTAGDLNGGDLAEEMEKEKNLYGVADATVKISGDLKTLIFCASVRQADRLAEIINRHKENSAIAINGKTPKEEREQVLKDYHDGKFQYLVNCSLFTEGFDEPDVACVVFARPTKSRALYAQMLGRGTRPHSSVARTLGDHERDERVLSIARSPKPSVLVLDFVGNSGRHKLVNSIDILGGCGSNPYDEKDIALAKKHLENACKVGAMLTSEEALEKARLENEERRKRAIARRVGLKASATWIDSSVDPFHSLGIERPIAKGWDRAKKVSDKMLLALIKFKVPSPEKLNFAEAKAILGECIRRANEGRPSLAQEHLLKKLGVLYPVRTFQEASRLIETKKKAQQR